MNTAAIQSGKTVSIGAWAVELGRILGEIAGNPASVRRAPVDETEIAADVLWWRPSGSPEFWIGVSPMDAALLLGLRQGDAAGEPLNEARAMLAEILERSWGHGEIAAHGPADLAGQDSYNVEFAGGGSVRFLVVQTAPAPTGEPNLEMLMEIELPIMIRFGSTQMALKDVAGLRAGSIIEFERRVDAPVEVMVNGHVVALGEAVTIKGSYGIRISEISSRRERFVTSSLSNGADGRGDQ